MRPSHDETGLRYAEVAQQRATCLRRAVGCVLMNERNQVIATGYNGRAAGLRHCNERVEVPVQAIGRESYAVPDYPHACAGALAPSGQQLDACEAIHAEQNALLQCGDVYSINTCYVTHSPCVTCVKLLMNTGCTRIVFSERYAHDEPSRSLWQGKGKAFTWLHLSMQP